MNQPLPPWPPTDPADQNAAPDPPGDTATAPSPATPATPATWGASPFGPPGVGYGPPPWIGFGPPPPPPRKVWPIVMAGLGGVFVGVVLTLIGVTVLTFTDVGMRDGKKYEASSAATEAQPGDCFRDRDLIASEASEVDCDDPHGFEVYARHPALSGEDAPYPTEDFDLMADDICIEEFKAYVSGSYYDSGLEYTILIPSREAWAKGERDIVCGLYDMDGTDLRGTSKGSGR